MRSPGSRPLAGVLAALAVAAGCPGPEDNRGSGSSGGATASSGPAGQSSSASWGVIQMSSSAGPAPSSSAAAASSSTSRGPAVPLLESTPGVVEFGVLPLNAPSSQEVTVRNISGRTLQLGATSTECSPPGGMYIIPFPPAGEFAPGATATFTVYWSQLGTDQAGFVTVPVADGDGYALKIPVHGVQDLGPLECSCPADVHTRPLQTVHLGATCTDPNGAALTHEWVLLDKPGGSTSQPTAPAMATTDFYVDLAGTYRLRFTGRDARGGESSSCEVRVLSVPPQQLHLQLVWDTDRSDVDLHLLGPNGGSWFSRSDPASDCHYQHEHPAWSTPSPDDDASLDIDDVDGFGPENINVVAPAPGAYVLGAHYFCTHGATAPTTATVRVYCNGALAQEFQQQVGSRQFWDVATILWPECSITPAGNPLRSVTEGCSE